jgi:predicted nucleic acid-binding protein
VGLITPPGSGTVYIDTNPLIYRIERIEPYLSASKPLWDALRAGTIEVYTSELTALEVAVKPLRDKDTALYDLYQRILYRVRGFEAIAISSTVLQRAAQVRVDTGLKTPDAIHAATALGAGCAMFVTNDPAFRRVSGLNVVVLSEVIASP